MDKTSLTPFNYVDAFHIAANLRDSDIVEVYAATGLGPVEAVKLSCRVSQHKYILKFGKDPVALGGFYVPDPHISLASPWLLGTDVIQQNPMTFLRACKTHLVSLFDDFEVLTNYVDQRNQLAQEWLQWMGFQIFDPEPYGVKGQLFHKFELRR